MNEHWVIVSIVLLEISFSWINTKGTWKSFEESPLQLLTNHMILEHCTTELIGNISNPILLNINPSLFSSFSSFFLLDISFAPILMTQHDFLSEWQKRTEKKREKLREEPSCRWRYHKMIITTTIWRVHNWLNIKEIVSRSRVDL